MDSRILPRAAGLVAAALLGAALALGGATAVGIGGETTTVREVVSRSGVAPAFQGRALSINEIYQRSAPGVVQVTSTMVVQTEPDPFFGNPFGPSQQEQRSLGSGFVIDKTGHIITNFHVVEDARSVEVSFSNRETMRARIVGIDPATDIAVLKVDARARALTPLTLGDSDAVEVGDSVVAIGNPFGYERSITAGIVSALQREIRAPNLFSAIDHVIQTDAPINQGNSGGPLLNAQGQVIGVSAQIETGGTGEQGNVGIGFAIPINTVKDVAAQLIKDGKVEHAFLGVGVKSIDRNIARLFKLPVERGLIVERVEPGSAADEAGIRGATNEVVVDGESWPLGGDVIVSVDGIRVETDSRLRDVISAKRPGDEIELQIYRGDNEMKIEVKLGRQPSSPQS